MCSSDLKEDTYNDESDFFVEEEVEEVVEL